MERAPVSRDSAGCRTRARMRSTIPECAARHRYEAARRSSPLPERAAPSRTLSVTACARSSISPASQCGQSARNAFPTISRTWAASASSIRLVESIRRRPVAVNGAQEGGRARRSQPTAKPRLPPLPDDPDSAIARHSLPGARRRSDGRTHPRLRMATPYRARRSRTWSRLIKFRARRLGVSSSIAPPLLSERRRWGRFPSSARSGSRIGPLRCPIWRRLMRESHASVVPRSTRATPTQRKEPCS